MGAAHGMGGWPQRWVGGLAEAAAIAKEADGYAALCAAGAAGAGRRDELRSGRGRRKLNGYGAAVCRGGVSLKPRRCNHFLPF
jgi:hypothetical protein